MLRSVFFTILAMFSFVVFSQSRISVPFNDANDLRKFKFYSQNNSVSIENNNLKVNPDSGRSLLLLNEDLSPAKIKRDLRVSFNFKCNSTPKLTPGPADNITVPKVWFLFSQNENDISNCYKMTFQWTESSNDEIIFEKDASMENPGKNGLKPGGTSHFFELSPVINGDIFYTFQASLKQDGEQLKCQVSIKDGDKVLMSRSYSFKDVNNGAGQIAFGGDSGDKNAPLYLDDLSVEEGATFINEPIYFNTTISNFPFQLYLPEIADNIKGLLVFPPGHGGNSSYLTEGEYIRKFCDNHSFVAIGFKYGVNEEDYHQALQYFATVTNHNEILNAPLLMYGFSAGTGFIADYVNKYPEKIIAFVEDSWKTAAAFNASTYHIPGIFLNGENADVVTTSEQLTALNSARAKGAQFAALEKEGFSHLELGNFKLYLPFFESVLKARYPNYSLPLKNVSLENGWLMDNTTWGKTRTRNLIPLAKISAYNSYTADKTKASWFVDEDCAMVAAAFVTYKKQVAINQPYHGEEGENRTIFVKVSDSLSKWSKVEIYNYAQKLKEIQSGENLRFDYNNIPAGAHSLLAVATLPDGRKFSSYPQIMVFSKSEKTTSVIHEKEILNINTIPNPADKFIDLKNDDEVEVEIFENTGKMKYKGKSRKINTENWEEGMYYIKSISNSIISINKIVIIH